MRTFGCALALLTLMVTTMAHAQSIPASAETAEAALKASPRHGEWVDVPVEGGGPVRSYVVYPERADKAPVVVVIHEIFGLTDWVRAVADALAAEGYIAIAPDLLSGKGPDGGGTPAFAGDAVRDAVRGLNREEVMARIDGVRAFALKQPAAGESSAIIGFCWGGSTSWNYAVHQPELDAAVVYYGTGPTDRDQLSKIAAPVIGFYGGDDARVTSTVEGSATAMKELGKPFTSHVYPGGGHGFLRQQSGRDGANQRAAEGAWKETLAFLREHVK